MSLKRTPIPKAVEHQVREQCGQACANPTCRKWNTATHELHHINGDRSESTLENLILLCTNCHSEEQQGIITLAKIRLWKQMAESGYLAPAAGQTLAGSNTRTENHGIIAERIHVENITVSHSNEPVHASVRANEANAERIRMAKARIRDWIDEVSAAHPAYLYKSHERISAKMRSMKNLLADDLQPDNRETFARACVAFLETTSNEISPVVTPTPMTGSRSKEDQQREIENWHKPRKLLAARLTGILNSIH